MEGQLAELVAVNKSLREAEHQQQNQVILAIAAVEGLPPGTDGIAISDAQGRLLMSSGSAQGGLVPKPAKAYPPAQWPELYGCYHLDGHIFKYKDLPLYRALQGEVVSEPVHLIMKNGRARHVEVTRAIPVHDWRQRELIGAVVYYRVHHDVENFLPAGEPGG